MKPYNGSFDKNGHNGAKSDYLPSENDEDRKDGCGRYSSEVPGYFDKDTGSEFRQKDSEVSSSSKKPKSQLSKLVRRVWMLRKSMLDLGSLKDPLCVVSLSAFGLMHAGKSLSIYLPPYAEEVGVSPTEASTLLTIMGAVGMPSRIAAGFLADLKIVKASTIVGVSGLVMALTMAFTPLYTSYETLVGCAVVSGTLYFQYSNLCTLMFLEVVPLESLVKVMALSVLFESVSGTITHLIHGKLDPLRLHHASLFVKMA
ncbi:monocarboxylate transporter 12 [Aplysia californica]|uniref:Monocarboxylate transporter 12 n=1 Tax=Aplysia californica TaxID=6500 RepID=A0ABM0JQK6_APLCA|nr:monocarboxylate transporter 12 [Aplysia californica]